MNPRHCILALALVALLAAIGRTAANQPNEKMNDSRHDMLNALGADRPHPVLGEEANAFDRFIGTWDCDYANFKEDGTTERSHGQVVFGWILDGRAVQDVWSWVDEDDPKKGAKGWNDGSIFRQQDRKMAHCLDFAGRGNHQDTGRREKGRPDRAGRDLG